MGFFADVDSQIPVLPAEYEIKPPAASEEK
jgi:hypothetical protein